MAWNIMKVAFDASFKNARPTSCYRWFNHFIEITTIEGLENLNTSEVTTMSEMFSNCSNLVDLDLSHFDTSKVTDMANMFSYCTSARYIFVDNQLKMDNVEDSEDMFNFCISLTGAIDFDDDKTDGAYANIENGYLTDIKNKDQAKYIWAKHTDDTFTLYFGKKNKLGENEEYMPANYRDILPYTSSMKKVVFDESFKDARPASCCGYFAGFSNLTDIEGMEYLNTSKARDFNYMFYNSNPTIYCHPDEYAAVKPSWCLDGRNFRVYVDIDPAAEYGTLCVPQGSDLSADTYNGFDKLYIVTKVDAANGQTILKEEKQIEPGKAYIYHHNISSNDNAMAEIAYEPNDATANEPMTDGLLKGVFVPTMAPAGSYFLEKDTQLHLIPSDGVTVVFPYNAYLQPVVGTELPSTLTLRTDDASDINGVTDECEAANNGRIYDLMGRHVNTLVKGNVYIKDGKKIRL